MPATGIPRLLAMTACAPSWIKTAPKNRIAPTTASVIASPCVGFGVEPIARTYCAYRKNAAMNSHDVPT
jgi:hypothetical protein